MNVCSAIDNFRIPVVPSETRFWMLRTKAGYFYQEYLQDRFVALGWNVIGEDTSLEDETAVRDILSSSYGEKRPGLAINKCINFIHNIKKNDIIVIPDNRFVTIALAGEYYEEANLDMEHEIREISKIDDKQVNVLEVRCPYKKRRHITILKTVEIARINYKLANALSNFHGLSCLDDYSTYILELLYSIYSFRDDIMFCVNVTKHTPIKAREISKLMYGITELLCMLVPEDSLQTYINLNSPGKIVVALKKAHKKIKSSKLFLLLLIVIATGGKVKDVELPGFVQVIEDIKTLDSKVVIANLEAEAKAQEVELLKTQLQAEQLELIDKYLELQEIAEEQNIDLAGVLGNIDLLLEVKESMQLDAADNLDIDVFEEDEVVEEVVEENTESD